MMKKETPKKYTGNNVISVKMNNYVKPNPQVLEQQTQKWLTNGPYNEFFNYVEERYIGSPTSQAIIDGISNYIYAEGIKFSDSSLELSDVLKKADARLLVKDLKTQGAFALQVVYSKDRKSIARLYHIPVRQLAISKQQDITEEPLAYWYCFDWKLQNKFKPVLIPAFGKNELPKFDPEIEYSEIAYFRIPSPQPLYSLPDYVAGLQAAELEEELSNFFISHVKNQFQGSAIVNINAGIPDSDEAQEEAERAIKSKVEGTSNAGNTIISFNENKDRATTVDFHQIPDAYQRFEFLTNDARTRIMLAHKVNDPALFGLPMPSGFSSVADQLVTSLKILYRNQINPMREIVIDGLEEIFNFGNKGLKLEFIDFEELRVATPNNTTTIEPTI